MRIFIFYVCLFCPFYNFGQSDTVGILLKYLNDNSSSQIHSWIKATDFIESLDSTAMEKVFSEMSNHISSRNKVVKTRFMALEAKVRFYLPFDTFNEDTSQIPAMKQALVDAHKENEPFMIAQYNRDLGSMLIDAKRKAEALQYYIVALGMMEELGLKHFKDIKRFYFTLGELFYKYKKLDLAEAYLQQGMDYPNYDKLSPDVYALYMNTLGVVYREQKKYKQSINLLHYCMKFCDSAKITSWYNYAHDNRFDAFLALRQLDSCKKIADIAFADASTDSSSAIFAEAYYQYGMISFYQQQYGQAITFFQQAERQLQQAGFDFNNFSYKLYSMIYKTFDSIKSFNQAYLYYKKFKSISDSVLHKEKIYQEQYLFAKATVEKEQLVFRRYLVERKRSIRIRNISIVIILLITGGIIYWLERKRRSALRATQMAEINLKQFIQQFLQKEEELEKLKLVFSQREQSVVDTAKITELRQLMILTEDDWVNFQRMFEQATPGYILRLKEKAPHITEAELRLALLLQLKIDSKQIAAMQGIGVDTVHKTKQRLRNRFSSPSSKELDELLASL